MYMDNQEFKPGDKVTITNENRYLSPSHKPWNGRIVTIKEKKRVGAEGGGYIIKEFEDSSVAEYIPYDRVKKAFTLPENLFEIE